MCHVQRFSSCSFLRRKQVCALKLQCWDVKVLVVMFCGHLRAAEERVSVMTLASFLGCQML